MTCIFINAFSLREGGSLVVLRELLRGIHALHPDWSFHVATNEIALPQLPSVTGIHYHVVKRQQLAGWRSLWWYHRVLPRLLRDTGATVLFSQTNYLPLVSISIPSLLLVQNAGHFSPLFKQLTQACYPGLLSWLAQEVKGAWVRASMRRASLVTVQTVALKQAMLADTGLGAERISVIRHGPGLIHRSAHVPCLPPTGQPLLLGYITKFGVQKNFSVLFNAVALLRQRGLALRLVLTLGAGFGTDRVLAEAQRLGVSDLVDNHGELAPSAIAELYGRLHVFVFPSLCESFGFPLVEALASGLPLLVADTGSNRELAGEGALVFPPYDAATLADEIEALVTDAHAYAKQVKRSQQQAGTFSWRTAAAATSAALDALIGLQERS